MGIFTSPRPRYMPPLGRDDSNPDSSTAAPSTFLGRPPPAENDWLSRLAPQWPFGAAQAPNIVRAKDSDRSDADKGPLIAEELPEPPPPPPRRGVAPPTELPPGTQLKDGPGQPVVLPDGSKVPDRYSPTGLVMSPVGDLSDVAAAGRDAGNEYRLLRSDPATFEAGVMRQAARFGSALGHGGKFDYQRGPGNSITGFEQRQQFRNVSNLNVGLFGQQAGLSLEEVLKQAGEFAAIRSSNSKSDQPYGLDPRTREFIELGYKIGASGAYGPAATR